MQTMIAENIESGSKGKASLTSMLEGFKQLKESVEALNDSNSVMLMTVNRCIDYSKASNGVSLVPTMETICLEDAINNPIAVVSNQQSRVTVQLDPLDNRIARYIVTDRQWLKENILCLLSNAAKYSSREDRIRISIALIERSSEEGDRRAVSGAKLNRSRESLSSINLFKSFNLAFAVLPTTDKEGFQVDELDSPLADKDDDIDIEAAAASGCIYKEGGGTSIPPSQHLLVEVEDNGEGFSKEVRAKLFQSFSMDSYQDAGSSAGLGLFSLARRVDALHGRYGVTSRSDGQQGNCFWFSFPYLPDECGPVPTPGLAGISLPTEEESSTVASESRRELRVLLVDDSASVLRMTRMMLQRLGCVVDIAYNGSESLQMTLLQWDNGTPYDVVLTDIQMPVMNGFEYCRELRDLEKRFCVESSVARHQMVIGASANSDDDTATSAISAGIDAFLPKPYSSQLFLDLVHRLTKMSA